MKKIWKILYNTIFALVVLLIIAIAISFAPIPGNYKLYTVQSGSMEPAIHTGSLIFVKPFSDYSAGEIVTRMGKETDITITHRIIEKKEDSGRISFITKGDANDGADVGEVAKSEIIGKMMVKIPFLGYLVAFARTTQGFVLLVIIPATIVIYSEMQKIFKEIGKKVNNKNKIDDGDGDNIKSYEVE